MINESNSIAPEASNGAMSNEDMKKLADAVEKIPPKDRKSIIDKLVGTATDTYQRVESALGNNDYLRMNKNALVATGELRIGQMLLKNGYALLQKHSPDAFKDMLKNGVTESAIMWVVGQGLAFLFTSISANYEGTKRERVLLFAARSLMFACHYHVASALSFDWLIDKLFDKEVTSLIEKQVDRAVNPDGV